jgi:hypothetical protein
VTKYWKRRLTANVKGQSVKLDDLQAEFQIRQSDGQHPDWAYLRMLNLHDNTSNSIWGKGEFKIEAGYHQGPFGLIFSGEITQQRRGKLSGVDRYHDVMAISGAQAYSHAVVEKTFDKGTTQTEMAREAAKQMTREGVTVGHIGELFGNPPGQAVDRQGASKGLPEDDRQDDCVHVADLQRRGSDDQARGLHPGLPDLERSNWVDRDSRADP